MSVQLSHDSSGRVGIVGHAGIGHVHSVGGLVQDDSAGFCVAAGLLQQATGADLTITRAEVQDDAFFVELAGGGTGMVRARCGISSAEARLARAVEGQSALYCQGLAVSAFGRMYGQGVLEVPVALEGALAMAVVRTLSLADPRLHCVICQQDDQVDALIGGVLETQVETLSVLAVVNLTEGGIGPNEDQEGNAGSGDKAQLLELLGLNHIPTIIVESKSRRPDTPIGQRTFLVRATNLGAAPTVARALERAGHTMGVPMQCEITPPPAKGLLRRRTARLGQEIQALGAALEQADTAAEKVRITARLARLIREDCGGVTFMSDTVFDHVGGCGVIPGSGAVLSLLDGVTPLCDIPAMLPEDRERYTAICLRAAHFLANSEPWR